MPVLTLNDRQLYAMVNPTQLDGRISCFPAVDRGYASVNCFLRIGSDYILLIDSGFRAHGDAILADLERLVDREKPFFILPTVIGDFASTGNVRRVAENFPIVSIYGAVPDMVAWSDIDPTYCPYLSPIRKGALSTTTAIRLPVGERMVLGQSARHGFRSIMSPLRTLPSATWIYDEETQTLFSGEVFCHVPRGSPAGPWLAAADDVPGVDEVYRLLVDGRFWWLPGANTQPIRRAICEIFATYPVRTLAPRWGCLIQGPDLVTAHLNVLIEALALAHGVRQPKHHPPATLKIPS